IVMASHRWLIDRLMWARRERAYGVQRDYFEDPRRIGWVRTGDEERPGGVAVVLSIGEAGGRRRRAGAPDARYSDVTEVVKDPVHTDGEGWGDFGCEAGSVSVWVLET